MERHKHICITRTSSAIKVSHASLLATSDHINIRSILGHLHLIILEPPTLPYIPLYAERIPSEGRLGHRPWHPERSPGMRLGLRPSHVTLRHSPPPTGGCTQHCRNNPEPRPMPRTAALHLLGGVLRAMCILSRCCSQAHSVSVPTLAACGVGAHSSLSPMHLQALQSRAGASPAIYILYYLYTLLSIYSTI